jgi:hypothetical protein
LKADIARETSVRDVAVTQRVEAEKQLISLRSETERLWQQRTEHTTDLAHINTLLKSVQLRSVA